MIQSPDESRAVKTEEGVISRVNDTYAGTRLDFAELIAVQHFTRRFPVDTNADEETQRAVQEEHMRTLVQAVTAASNAAIRFAMAALGSYLNELPDAVITWDK